MMLSEVFQERLATQSTVKTLLYDQITKGRMRLTEIEAIQIPHEETKGEESPLLLELGTEGQYPTQHFLVPYPRLQYVVCDNTDHHLNRLQRSLNLNILDGVRLTLYGRVVIPRCVSPSVVGVLRSERRY